MDKSTTLDDLRDMKESCKKQDYCSGCSYRFECDVYTNEDALEPVYWKLPTGIDSSITLEELTKAYRICNSCSEGCNHYHPYDGVTENCPYHCNNCCQFDDATNLLPSEWILPACELSNTILREDVSCLSKKYRMKAKVIIKLPELIETDYPSDLNGLAFCQLCESLADLSSAEIANKIREYTRFKFKPVKDKGYKEDDQYTVPEPKLCPVCESKPLITFAPDSGWFTVKCRNRECSSAFACTDASAKVAVDGWNDWCEYKK